MTCLYNGHQRLVTHHVDNATCTIHQTIHLNVATVLPFSTLVIHYFTFLRLIEFPKLSMLCFGQIEYARPDHATVRV